MRVYLAGPDVFLPDPRARAAALKAICTRHGLDGISPLDPLAGGDPPGWAGLPEPYRIARRNEAHIAGCDALVANLTPFRGPSADAGTLFELGFMRALGRPVFGWSNCATPFAARTRAAFATTADTDGTCRDAEGLLVEDFPALSDNLMIDGAIAAAGGTLVIRDLPRGEAWASLAAFEACIAAVAAVLK
ncbi:MAG: nucleoside 2-deoxyribosyltransferase, partial [Acidobacteria bacterium]|nr:nucleoside 2-deoxyribosyltransferase [Acidobacteriota bacterium]